MSTLIVEVCNILEVRPHPDPETIALEITIVKGWECVVKKGSFKTGDKAVFIPVDAIVPLSLANSPTDTPPGRLGVMNYLAKLPDGQEGGRVKAARLRGAKSFGLIFALDPKCDPDWPVGTDVAEHFGITKWIPPLRCVDGDAMRPNPRFHSYTDIENIRNYPNAIKDGEEVVFTEKIHGCFQYSTPILLDDGSSLPIGKIVNQRLNVKVMSYNEKSGELEPKSILDWHNNGTTDEWLTVRVATAGKGNRPHRIICTPKHLFWTENGWTPANQLRANTNVAMPNLVLTAIQEQMILGSLLGDAYLYPTQRLGNNKGFQVGHVVDQEEYLRLKQNILGPLFSAQNERISGFGSKMTDIRSKCLPAITKIYKLFYKKNKKKITNKCLSNLTPMGLAFWYMDDGSISHTELQKDRVCFATNGFSESEVRTLSRFLKVRFGLNATPYLSSGWRLRLDTDSSQRFFLMVAPYIVSTMQYKLPPEYRGACYWQGLPDWKNKLSTIWSKVVSIDHGMLECYKKNSTICYDIEIEDNHNYFAGNTLVHNCNARMGYILEDNEEGKAVWTWAAGSHCVRRKEIDSNGKSSRFFDALKPEIKSLLTYLVEKHPWPQLKFGVIVFGEIYGSAVQDMAYGFKNGEWSVRVFDIAINGQYLDDDVKEELFNKFGVNRVPVLYRGPFSWEILDKHTDGLTTVCDPSQAGKFNFREGVVITPVKERESGDLNGRCIVKSISVDYLSRKKPVDNSQE